MNLKLLLVIFGIWIFCSVNGKECPEISRPHRTRCDMYFKCMILPSNTFVWIPTKCEQGLIYEPSIKVCVLPAEDWECNLDETNDHNDHIGISESSLPAKSSSFPATKRKIIENDHNIYGIDNLQYLKDEINNYRPHDQFFIDDDRSEQTISSSTSSSSSEITYNDDDIVIVNSDDDELLNDENSVDFIDGIDQIIDHSVNATVTIDDQKPLKLLNKNKNSLSDDEIESSGDGIDTNNNNQSIFAEKKGSYIAIPIDSDPNSTVAKHLQRLSQLIQSLSDSQNNKTTGNLVPNELGPNDLNNFLTNHNIQTNYEYSTPSTNNDHKKHTIGHNGGITAEHMQEILDLQHKLQNFDEEYLSIARPPSATQFPIQATTMMMPIMSATTTSSISLPTPLPTPTKIEIKSSASDHQGYSTSQIVVNRPEGSVLFSLPGSSQSQPTAQSPQHQQQNSISQSLIDSNYGSVNNREPYISENTLKAVLELSKQMIAANNNNNNHYQGDLSANQQLDQQQKYLQPIFRPIYYNIPIHDIPIPIINNYERINDNGDGNGGNSDRDEKDHYQRPQYSYSNKENNDNMNEKISSVKGYVINRQPYYNKNDHDRQYDHNKQSDHDTDDNKKSEEIQTIIHNHIPITIEQPILKQNKQQNSPSSGSSHQQTHTPSPQQYSSDNQIYHPYPPFQDIRNVNVQYQQELSTPTALLGGATQSPPQFNPYQQLYYQQQQPTSPATPPSGQQQFQSQPYNSYSNFYTPTPHLTDHNVNNYVNVNTPQYPTLRPQSYLSSDPINSFPSQINSPSLQYYQQQQQQQQQLQQPQSPQSQPQQSQRYSQYDNDGSIGFSINNNNRYVDQQMPSSSSQQHQVQQQQQQPSQQKYMPSDTNRNSNEQLYQNQENPSNLNYEIDEENDDDTLTLLNENSNTNLDLEDNNDNDSDNDDENVMNLLASLKNQKQKFKLENKQLPSSSASSTALDTLIFQNSGPSSSFHIDQSLGNSNDDSALLNYDDLNSFPTINEENKNKIVHYGDTYMTLEAYKNSVEPLIKKKSTIEIITCVTGARQPSSANCSKYFVCNSMTGKVLTYSCPQYTAFNQDTRFCDAKSYLTCNSGEINKQQITIDTNKELKKQAEQSLLEAKRIRNQALKAQQLTVLIKKQTQQLLNNNNNNNNNNHNGNSNNHNGNGNNRPFNGGNSVIGGAATFIRRPAVITQPNALDAIRFTTTTKRTPPIHRRKPLKPQKRRIQCNEPTKVADKLSIYNYFTCYKGVDGKLKAMKQTCPTGLMFCPTMRLCTAKEKCGR